MNIHSSSPSATMQPSSPSFHIRRATLLDCDLIHTLAEQVFPATYREILTKEQIDYMMEWMYAPDNIQRQMEEEGHIYLLAITKQGDTAGYVSVQQEEESLFHLQKIYVLPRYQQTRCGRFLFENAVGFLRSRHPEPFRIELNVNRQNRALGFYEHMGMRKLHEGDFPIGNGYYMNDYIMGLDVK